METNILIDWLFQRLTFTEISCQWDLLWAFRVFSKLA